MVFADVYFCGFQEADHAVYQVRMERNLPVPAQQGEIFTVHLHYICYINFYAVLWLIHTTWDRDRDRDRETMGFCIMLCTVHTTQGQVHGTIVFYCARPFPCHCPGPVQWVWAITRQFSIPKGHHIFSFKNLFFLPRHSFTPYVESLFLRTSSVKI